MKEYIERAALKRELAPYEENDFSQQMDVILAIVDAQPTADVVEVRHGRWGEYESFPLTSSLNGHPCSECGMHFSTLAIPVMKYCPNCGARMDKEDEHDKHSSNPV